jgi:hypothetical protein
MRRFAMLIVALAAVLAFVGAVAAHEGESSEGIETTAMAGPYSVTLEVLPAESFGGYGAAMTWDGGAQPVKESGKENPNHHLVAFVKRNGKPVTDAKVDIRYRRTSPKEAPSWQDLPVARMHVSDKGMSTTHYGNNVELAPGRYSVKVDVNGKETMLDITLPA